MRLETKLGWSTGLLVLAMMLTASSAHLRIAESNSIWRRLIAERVPLIIQVRDGRSHVARSTRALESYLLFPPMSEAAVSYRKERETQLAEAQKVIGDIDAGALRARVEDSSDLGRIQNGLSQLDQMERQVEELNEAKTPQNTAAAFALLNAVLTLDDQISAEIGMISTAETVGAARESERLEQANTRTIFSLWTQTILSALVASVILYVFRRKVRGAMNLLVSRANEIAGGDLRGQELQVKSGDQIEMLAEAMNRMQTSLGGIIGTVADTAGSLTGSAVSMQTASDQIHQRIDQQSQQTQQAATAMQEMSASIAEVSRHTQSAAETARAAAKTARDGGQIVDRMLGSMHSIADAVTQTSLTVGLLGEDSKRISQIVTVIDEIARKTNLLALNAAIEAARAGDQGRGFAVVAGEVRRLAESTAQATGEIGTMIREIQERTRMAIASMSAGTGTVREGVVTTTQAGEALERIIGMAERVDRMIAQIAIAASQQAAAADQSSASLDSIHMLSHENLSEMATTAAGIEGLRGTAVTLERQVDRFQVLHGAVRRRAA